MICKSRLIYIIALFSLMLFSCERKTEITADNDNSTGESPNTPNHNQSINSYSFFAAGHVYGDPSYYQPGMHKPMKNYIPILNDYEGMELAFFTGDIVQSDSKENWDAIQADFSLINYPIHIAAGNHDRCQEFNNRFGEYYYDFVHNNDLFVVLSPTSWNIEGEQKDFLFSSLEENSDNVNNIFIFCHELIWWSPDSIFQNVKINWEPHYPGNTNYWNEIDPFLKSIDKPITLFAGDVGCSLQVSPFMYHAYDNITLIASGVGGGVKDNIIITNVDTVTGEVIYNLTTINGSDPAMLGNIEDYVLP